jgi:hypothetical protein
VKNGGAVPPGGPLTRLLSVMIHGLSRVNHNRNIVHRSSNWFCPMRPSPNRHASRHNSSRTHDKFHLILCAELGIATASAGPKNSGLGVRMGSLKGL